MKNPQLKENDLRWVSMWYETIVVKHRFELIFSIPLWQIHNQISLAQNTNTCTDTSSASHTRNIVKQLIFST